MGEKAGITHEEIVNHVGKLTPAELITEKRLRRKLDMRIMPCVIMVYLMNYIDRYHCSRHCSCDDTDSFPKEQLCRRQATRSYRRP